MDGRLMVWLGTRLIPNRPVQYGLQYNQTDADKNRRGSTIVEGTLVWLVGANRL